MKTTVIIPDLQTPDHDPKYLTSLLAFIADFQPDALVNVGDLLDSPEPARWSKGYAEEYAPTLQKSADMARDILRKFTAAAPNATRDIRLGNHDERVETYVSRYAPALGSLSALRFENLVGLGDSGWRLHRRIFAVAPGWVCAHGHEGSLRPTAGGTAIGLARKLGYSVVCGHTHRAGLVPESFGFNGQLKTLVGMEVGHGMDIRKASYLKTGAGNWQQSFGILRIEGQKVFPELVLVQPGGRFIVEGSTYSA